MKRVAAFIGFSMAVTLLTLNIVPYNITWFILLFVMILFIVSLLFKNIRREKVLPITFGSMLIACLIFITVMQCSVLPQKALENQMTDVQFKIVDVEEKTDSGYIYTIKTSSINILSAPQNIRLKIKSDFKIEADYYDNIKGVLVFYNYTDSAFDSYGDYAENIFIRAKLIQIKGITAEYSKPISYYFLCIRLAVKEKFINSFEPEKAGLALSLFTGDKSELNEDIKELFKVCGISHMTAVSGLHISLICLLIYYFLRRIKIPLMPVTFITLCVLSVYSGVCGYSKSVLRSGIMVTVVIFARLINNKADILNSLGFAVFIMCLNPFAVTDASALFTVTAVVGLSIIKPAYDEKIRPKNKILCYFYDGVFATISVLAATFPVAWLLFGKISLIAIVINFIAIPILELILILLIFLMVFYSNGVLAYIPQCAADFLLDLLINISSFFRDNFSVLYIDISEGIVGVSIAGILLFCGISLLVSYKINLKILSLFISAVIVLTTVFCVYNHKNNVYFTIGDNGGIVIYDKDCIVAFDIDDSSDYYLLCSKTKYKSVIIIGSDEYESKIRNVFPDARFEKYDFSEIYLDDNICIKNSGESIYAIVFDKHFKISDDCVTIGEQKFFRNIYERFGEKGDVTFIAAEDSYLQLEGG